MRRRSGLGATAALAAIAALAGAGMGLGSPTHIQPQTTYKGIPTPTESYRPKRRKPKCIRRKNHEKARWKW